MIQASIDKAAVQPTVVFDNEVWTLTAEETEDVALFHCEVHTWSKQAYYIIYQQFQQYVKGEARECYAWCPNFKVYKFALMLGMEYIDTVINTNDNSIGYLVKEGVCLQHLQQ